MHPASLPILALLVLLGGSFIFGLVYLVVPAVLGPFGLWNENWAFDRYMTRMLDEEKPPVIAHVVLFGMGLGAMAGMFAAALALALVVSLFWFVPPVAILMPQGVSFTDAADYAIMNYVGVSDPWVSRVPPYDPGLIVLFLFNLVFWLAVAAALLIVVFAVVLVVRAFAHLRGTLVSD